VFAYLESSDYRRQLKQANMRTMFLKLQKMKNNRFFSELSSTKIQKMSYYLQPISLIRNQVLYKEGEEIKGIYIISEGSVKYIK